ncbi:MAG: ATP-binding protein [Magnetococcus sp. YQC-3]
MTHLSFGRDHPERLQWGVLILFLVLLAGGIVAGNLYQLNAKEKREEERLTVMTNIIAKNLAWRFEIARSGLSRLRKSVATLKSPADLENATQHLQLMLELVKGLRTINIFNKAGDVLLSNRRELIGKNFAFREYFKAPQENPRQDMLYVSQPFLSSLGVFALNLSAVITDDQGGFNGLISFTLDPEYFSTLLDSVRYAPDVWCAIAHGDGVLFMDVPPRAEIQGKNLAVPGSFFSRHVADGRASTVMSGTVYATGERNMLAQRTFQPADMKMDRPLLIAVGRSLDLIYKPDLEDAWMQGGLFLLVVLISSAALAFHQRRHRQHLELIRDGMVIREKQEVRLQEVNEELMQFIFVASHDLQEPLRAMISYAEFLRQDVPDECLNDAAREDIRFVTESAKLMQQNIQDLLLYSRVLRLEFRAQPVDLNHAMRTAMENLQPFVEASEAQVTWQDLPTVSGESATLTRALHNLLDNAIKFRRPGIVPEVRVEAARTGEEWLIQVTDNGIGMEEKYLSQIFQPFKRLHGKKAYSGTGLGLSVVRKIVEQHGGSIQVSSTPGEGSVFSLTLPAYNVNPMR